MKEERVNQTGFIAQELKEVFPGMVMIGAENVNGEMIEDFHKINTAPLTPHLVVGMQELAMENTELKERLAAMEKQMASLTQVIATLQESSRLPSPRTECLWIVDPELAKLS